MFLFILSQTKKGLLRAYYFSVKAKAGLPWLFVTFVVLIADFVAASLSMTDFNTAEMSSPPMSCQLSEWSERKAWTTSVLLLYFSRGAVIWILNLWLFLGVTFSAINWVNIS